MQSKFKDYLLYTLSTIGVVALFISATTLPPQTSTVPESHVWELVVGAYGNGEGRAYLYNKVTGEVRKYSRIYPEFKGVSNRDEAKSYIVMKDIADMN